MRWTVLCRRCWHDIPIGNGWDFMGEVVECPACFTLNAVHVDENMDMDYWFFSDVPYGDEKIMESAK